jgi:hypothetical protein
MAREEYSNPLTGAVEEINESVDLIQLSVDDLEIATDNLLNITENIGVNSIQRGTVSFPNDLTFHVNVTISAVDLSKSIVLINSTGVPSGDAGRIMLTARFTSPTNLRIERGSPNGTATGDWQVVEYK